MQCPRCKGSGTVKGDSKNGGYRNGRAKLKESDVQKIKALGSMVSQKDLGTMFGVNEKTIGDIIRGRTWSHVKSIDWNQVPPID